MVDTWDEAKRKVTLAERGLDFADAHLVFAGSHYTRAADKGQYGEQRFITAGFCVGALSSWYGHHAMADDELFR